MNSCSNFNMNQILNRTQIYSEIQNHILSFYNNPNNQLKHSGIYIYGNTGIGKTFFVKQLLQQMNLDIILFDACNIRNKNFIQSINEDKLSNQHIYHLMHHQIKRNVIVMDEIDGMTNGDKGGINTLITLIRPKKTKRQKKEKCVNAPIICIGNYHIDKKINELMKVCQVFKFETPTINQVEQIIQYYAPQMEIGEMQYILNYTNGNLHKLYMMLDVYLNQHSHFQKLMSNNHIHISYYSNDAKNTVACLLKNQYSMETHEFVINDADRTTVGLLWHENIVDHISSSKKNTNEIAVYRKQLDNMCFSDYLDRLTFQKQIWELGEIISLIKVFYNHYLFHQNENQLKSPPTKEIRFTKMLTKRSTEYNSVTFIKTMCQKLLMDKKDVLALFTILKDQSPEITSHVMQKYDISRLEVDRIYRFMNITIQNVSEMEEEEDPES